MKDTLLEILNLLTEQTDENHPLSHSQIAKKLNINRKTVLTDMRTLRDTYNIDIIQANGNKGWYLGERRFSIGQVNILLNLISNSDLLSFNVQNQIKTSIIKDYSKYQKESLFPDLIDSSNTNAKVDIVSNINNLYEIIRLNKLAEIILIDDQVIRLKPNYISGIIDKQIKLAADILENRKIKKVNYLLSKIKKVSLKEYKEGEEERYNSYSKIKKRVFSDQLQGESATFIDACIMSLPDRIGEDKKIYIYSKDGYLYYSYEADKLNSYIANFACDYISRYTHLTTIDDFNNIDFLKEIKPSINKLNSIYDEDDKLILDQIKYAYLVIFSYLIFKKKYTDENINLILDNFKFFSNNLLVYFSLIKNIYLNSNIIVISPLISKDFLTDFITDIDEWSVISNRNLEIKNIDWSIFTCICFTKNFYNQKSRYNLFIKQLELIKDNKSKLKNDQLNKELINMLSKLGFIILSNDKTANIDNIIENVKLVLKS